MPNGHHDVGSIDDADDDGAAVGVGTLAERVDTFAEDAADMSEEGSMVAARERLCRSRIGLHLQEVVVPLLPLVVEEDSRWHGTGLGIEVGWCDSLEVGQKEAVMLECHVSIKLRDGSRG